MSPNNSKKADNADTKQKTVKRQRSNNSDTGCDIGKLLDIHQQIIDLLPTIEDQFKRYKDNEGSLGERKVTEMLKPLNDHLNFVVGMIEQVVKDESDSETEFSKSIFHEYLL